MDYPFFEKIGLTRQEADVYLSLYKLWSQPASSISNSLWIERTKVYRKLIKMTKMWIVRKTQKHWVTHFFIEDVRDLKKIIWRKTEDTNYLNMNQDRVLSLIEKSKIGEVNVPKITLYEAGEGVNNIFEDIMANIKKQWILTIRIFASNTIEERDAWEKIWEYASNFFKNLEKENIHIDEYIGVGNLLMERIEHYVDSVNLGELPAAKSSINIILVWNILYFVIYNEAPLWIKIENENLTDAMHILFDEIKRFKAMNKKAWQNKKEC